MIKKYFTCVICDETLPASQLSTASLNESGCETKVEAINAGSKELVCRWCDEEEELDLSDVCDLDGEEAGRNETEAWELSGLTLDPARLQAHRNSY